MSRKPDKTKKTEGDIDREPIPFDDALRILVNTPPKPKKSDDKSKVTNPND